MIETWLDDPFVGVYFKPFVMFRDGKIKFMKISATTTVVSYAPAEIQEPVLEKW